MTKIQLPNASTRTAVIIKSTTEDNTYWQCGMWVRGKQNATRYVDSNEANGVIQLRSLHDIEIIEA